MIAPKYIQQELKLIDPMYFAVYNPFVSERTHMSYGKGRWQIRKWKGVYPKELSRWNTDASGVFTTICVEEYSSDRGLYDAGYKGIDMREIEEIKEARWFVENIKEEVIAMDARNQKREDDAEREEAYLRRYFAKKIWRIKHEPTVNLSGREWRL